MRVPPPPRAIVPVLAASAGVVLAHAVDYAVLFPSAQVRSTHLGATGHGYWAAAVAIALGAAALAVVLAAARGALRAARPARLGAGGAGMPGLGWLLGFQVGAFVLLEAGERGLIGLPPSVLLHRPEFWLGLALQLPVALLARRFLGGVEGAAFRITARLRSGADGVHAPRLVRRPPVTTTVTAAAVAAAARPRGPPLPRCA